MAQPLGTERIYELVKRHLKDAGLSPHSFRVTAITSLLEQRVPMEVCSAWPGTRSRERRRFTTGGRRK
jgi:integrase